MIKNIFLIFVYILISYCVPEKCLSEKIYDDKFGLGLVSLSIGKEQEAEVYFLLSNSKNSLLMLEALNASKVDIVQRFNYNDPTLLGFRGYLEILAKKPKYAFFSKILDELDARNPNKEMGELGIFNSAYFSQKSNFLVIYCSNKTILVKSETGEMLEEIVVGYEKEYSSADIFIAKDETYYLKIVEKFIDEEANYIISYNNMKNNDKIWERSFSNRIIAKFSNDNKYVSIYNDIPDSTSLTVIRIDTKTGKENSRKVISIAQFDDIINLTNKEENLQEFPLYQLESPNKKFKLAGNKGYGQISLYKDNQTLVREFWFASDIE